VSWLPGGFFTLDTFFVLSGFLITTLLLQEVRHTGTVRLVAFWGRRARRLLPALLVMVAFCSLFVAYIAERGTYPGYRGDALGTLFYVANWHFISQGASYFIATTTPSPLTHTWSLAVEEQFYVVWPLVVLVLVKLRVGLRSLTALCVGGAVASSVWMALRFQQGAQPTRLYFGTDTHAQSILVGAALAGVLALISEHRRATGSLPTGRSILGHGGDPGWLASSHRARRALGVTGVLGAIGTGLLWWKGSDSASLTYEGGFLLAALLSALMLASAISHQRGVLARLLSLGPLVYVGRVSYGLYLWHFPLFAWINSTRTGLEGSSLLLVRLLAAFAAAVASFYLVERPIRRGSLLRGWKGFAAAVGGLGATAMLVVVVTAGISSASLVLPSSGRVSSHPVFSAAGPAPTRVFVTGDSMALTLGMVMNNTQMLEKARINVTAHGFLGCGVVHADNVMFFTQVAPDAPPCKLGEPSYVSNFTKVARDETLWHPNIVIVLSGHWEADDTEIGGQWTNILDPAFQALVVTGLEQEVSIAESHHAKVVLMTSPCTDSGIQPNGEPLAQDSLQRIEIYNSLVRRVAAAHPGEVSVYDLAAQLCPGGEFTPTIDGYQVRTPDGVHLAVAGQPVIDPPLFAYLDKLAAQAHLGAQKPK
jgi:peptidoglycan/LPS O-acetylase OafA/YrhL